MRLGYGLRLCAVINDGYRYGEVCQRTHASVPENRTFGRLTSFGILSIVSHGVGLGSPSLVY